MTKQIKNKDEDIKAMINLLKEADERQGKDDIEFLENVILSALLEEEVAKYIPEEGQRLLRKKLVSLMDKKLGL
jgi:DNA-binding transcriptional regulator GbsR (MarR family)